MGWLKGNSPLAKEQQRVWLDAIKRVADAYCMNIAPTDTPKLIKLYDYERKKLCSSVSFAQRFRVHQRLAMILAACPAYAFGRYSEKWAVWSQWTQDRRRRNGGRTD